MSDLKLNDLSKSMSSTLSASEEQSGALAGAVADCIKVALSASKSVSIPQFGVFSLAGEDGEPVMADGAANLSEDVSAKVGESSDRVESMITALFDGVKKELLAGKRIVLDDLGVFEVQPSKVRQLG